MDATSPQAHIPRATYRLQFTPDFGFADARQLVPYLARLGISDIYCSPVLTSRPGSTHGYDVIDPLHINPQLGGRAAFDQLATAALGHGLGLLLDIVPNHMAASIDNPWWYDVLENGPSSQYAHFFDIEWDPADPNESLHNRVLLPILGSPYGEALEAGEIQIEATDDGFLLRYYEHRLPLSLESYAPILRTSASEIRPLLDASGADWASVQQLLGLISRIPRRNHFDPMIARQHQRLRERIGKELVRLRTLPAVAPALERGLQEINGTPGEPRSFDRLDRIVRMQSYRLAFWQIAREQINYRRFFDINDLVSLRVEEDDVFEATHRFILELAASGAVAGLRVDHVDGLWDPSNYLRRLRERLDEVGPRPGSTFVIVEKILSDGEALPEDWPVNGTTGYDALNLLGDLFVDAARLPALETVYRRMSGGIESYSEIVYRAKRHLLVTTFAAYVRSLTFALEAVSNSDRHGRDLTFDSLQQALIETTAALPVYRTYTNSLIVGERDRAWVAQAIEQARSCRPDLRHTLDFLARVLTLNIPGYVSRSSHPAWLDVVMRWQQLCGPVMAKGNEDTALYRSYPLLSRNEVGGYPERVPPPADEVHARLQTIATNWPRTMVATSTHDTKRSEDVRARIAVLSELPEEWSEHLTTWQQLNTGKRATRDAIAIPDGKVEYLIYQTMVGAWPLDPTETDAFQQRLGDYVIKAVREAKEHTSWTEPDAVYEEELHRFIAALFDEETSAAFLADFAPFQQRIARLGALNSLSQTEIKLTVPGVPDTYQGSELWDLSLVDPDNRRPVDYTRSAEALTSLEEDRSRIELLHELTGRWHDGRIKLFLLKQGLDLRRRHPELFSQGDYRPAKVSGRRQEHVFAFVRTHRKSNLLVVAPRLFASIIDEGNALSGWLDWDDAMVELPRDWTGTVHDLISTQPVPTVNVRGARHLRLPDVLRYFPVGLLGNDPLNASSGSA